MKSIALKRCRTAPGTPRTYRVRRSESKGFKKGQVVTRRTMRELCAEEDYAVTVHA